VRQARGEDGEDILEFRRRVAIHSDATLAGFQAMAGKQDFVVGIELDRVTAALEGGATGD
jgi:hypothetical protein